jgi:hypothetical protein
MCHPSVSTPQRNLKHLPHVLRAFGRYRHHDTQRHTQTTTTTTTTTYQIKDDSCTCRNGFQHYRGPSQDKGMFGRGVTPPRHGFPCVFRGWNEMKSMGMESEWNRNGIGMNGNEISVCVQPPKVW